MKDQIEGFVYMAIGMALFLAFCAGLSMCVAHVLKAARCG